MTKAEQLYCGQAGQEYWKRNQKRLDTEMEERMKNIRSLIPENVLRARPWVEVGCGQGHNMSLEDVGIDIDPRQIAHVISSGSCGIVAPAYRIPLPDQSYEVVFSVGCLMHLPPRQWGGPIFSYSHLRLLNNGDDVVKAIREMVRIARSYIIIGEYWADHETEIEWHGEKGVLWARPYEVPGFTLTRKVSPLPPFDSNITFGVFKKIKY